MDSLGNSALGFEKTSLHWRWTRKTLLGESASRCRGVGTSGPRAMPTLLVSDPRRCRLGKGMDITKTWQWKEMEK